MPLERALSKLGLASRAEAREWILAGRVWVHGRVERDPLKPVSPERAAIRVDGAAVTRAERRVFLLHKPRGTVTTRVDEKGRPTVFELVAGLDLHLIAVGRLDWATSGLLLLTNDTRLADWLTDPAHGVARTYLVTVRGEVTAAGIARLREGVTDEGERLRADEAELRKASGRESHLVIGLREGKNREVRRLCLAIGHEVTRLKRVAYGDLMLPPDLEPGKWLEVSAEEISRCFPGSPAPKPPEPKEKPAPPRKPRRPE